MEHCIRGGFPVRCNWPSASCNGGLSHLQAYASGDLKNLSGKLLAAACFTSRLPPFLPAASRCWELEDKLVCEFGGLTVQWVPEHLWKPYHPPPPGRLWEHSMCGSDSCPCYPCFSFVSQAPKTPAVTLSGLGRRNCGRLGRHVTVLSPCWGSPPGSDKELGPVRALKCWLCVRRNLPAPPCAWDQGSRMCQ